MHSTTKNSTVVAAINKRNDHSTKNNTHRKQLKTHSVLYISHSTPISGSYDNRDTEIIHDRYVNNSVCGVLTRDQNKTEHTNKNTGKIKLSRSKSSDTNLTDKKEKPCVINVQSPEPSLDRLSGRIGDKPSARIILNGSIAFEKPISDDESEKVQRFVKNKRHFSSQTRPSRPARRKKGTAADYWQHNLGISGSELNESEAYDLKNSSVSCGDLYPRLEGFPSAKLNKEICNTNGVTCYGYDSNDSITSIKMKSCEELDRNILYSLCFEKECKQSSVNKGRDQNHSINNINQINKSFSNDDFEPPSYLYNKSTPKKPKRNILNVPGTSINDHTFYSLSMDINGNIERDHNDNDNYKPSKYENTNRFINTLRQSETLLNDDDDELGSSNIFSECISPNTSQTQIHPHPTYVDLEFRTSSQSLKPAECHDVQSQTSNFSDSLSNSRSRSCSPLNKRLDKVTSDTNIAWKRSRSADLSLSFDEEARDQLILQAINQWDETSSSRTEGDTDILSNEGTYLSLSWDFTDAEFLQVSNS